jgi:hypothetical protein
MAEKKVKDMNACGASFYLLHLGLDLLNRMYPFLPILEGTSLTVHYVRLVF